MNCSGLIRTMLPAVLFAGPALAQDVPNAARKVEVSFLFLGSVRTGGTYQEGRCADVAVTVTESVSIAGATCATHQYLAGTTVEAEDSLGSYRGGPRFRKRFGRRITTFLEGLAGVETGFRHGGFRSNTGFSIDAGGGVDLALKSWLGLRMIHAKYQTTWIDGGNVNGLLVHAGLVFRFGKR